MTRSHQTACRVMVRVFCVCLGLCEPVGGQVVRTPDEVRKLAVGKYKVRVFWGNHLHLREANLTRYAGNSAGAFVPSGEVELIERNKELILKGEPFEGDVPLAIDGLRLSRKPLSVANQPDVNARVKYTTLSLIQSLDASLLCGLSHFTNGGPVPKGDNVYRSLGYDLSNAPPSCHGIAAFYLARSDGRREEYTQPLGADGEVYRPKFKLGVHDPAGLAPTAAANATALLGAWLQANGFDLQPNPKAPAPFQFGVSVTTSFTPPSLNQEQGKYGRFIALDGTNDVVVTNPLGVECGLTLTNAGLAGKPLLRAAYAIGLSGGATAPSTCNLETEIRTLYVNQEKYNVYQPSPCYQYPSPLVMMLPARLALEKGKLKGFSSRLEEIAYRRK